MSYLLFAAAVIVGILFLLGVAIGVNVPVLLLTLIAGGLLFKDVPFPPGRS